MPQERWPAGTSGGKGGEFRPTGGTASLDPGRGRNRGTGYKPPPTLAPDTFDYGLAQKYRAEIEPAAQRALAAGAVPPLHLYGIGMTAVVFTDKNQQRVFKVARDPRLHDSLREEAEWFRAAQRDPFVSKHVPAGVHWDEKNGVLVKTAGRGRVGNEYRDGSKLSELHGQIEKAMLRHGWTSPEFKADSYVFPERGGGPILVDGGMAIRLGKTLLKHVDDVLAGRKKTRDSLDDLGFYVTRETRREGKHGTFSLEPEEGDRALRALRAAGMKNW